MTPQDLIIETARLTLRPWQEADRADFAQLHADPDVMADLGGPITRVEADRKFDRYRRAYDQFGYSRWAVHTSDGAFIGYAGVMPRHDMQAIGSHDEIGWRLHRHAWGKGYASEAARAALQDASTRLGLTGIISYTTPENVRSQSVMDRLGLVRDPARDFTEKGENFEEWRCLVWTVPPIEQLRTGKVTAT